MWLTLETFHDFMIIDMFLKGWTIWKNTALTTKCNRTTSLGCSSWCVLLWEQTCTNDPPAATRKSLVEEVMWLEKGTFLSLLPATRPLSSRSASPINAAFETLQPQHRAVMLRRRDKPGLATRRILWFELSPASWLTEIQLELVTAQIWSSMKIFRGNYSDVHFLTRGGDVENTF